MNEQSATIYVATDEKQLNVAFFVGDTVEDLCIKICQFFKIGPVARHLFGFRNYSSNLWLPYGYKFKDREKYRFYFRLRFKLCSMHKLKQLDEEAYNYYFQQVRADIMNNKVPDIIYEKHKDELIGLGVSDMYRVMLEKQLPRETVESEYKKYIPKECIKRHAFFVKKPIYNALAGISKGHLDASYVKEQYLQQFESMAPNYLYEEYKALMDKGTPNPPAEVLLRINREEVKYYETDVDDWKTLCTIEDLCFISIRQDNTVEISRKNGIPSYLKFMGRTNETLMSFVSILDGYYRLSVKWTFNLCRDVITPTLEKLYKLRCHGPVGKEFSYAKLKEKRANKPGTYILRESETEYNVYYIDICNKAGKSQSHRVDLINQNNFLITNDSCTQNYVSLGDLICSFQNPNYSLQLECLPPSEYDVSSLLICASENLPSETAADEDVITLLEGGPRCVSQNQLQVLQILSKNNINLTPISFATRAHQAIWQIVKGKKLEIVTKMLTSANYTKEFLEVANKWGKLRSGALIRLYGITVSPLIGMLLELVKLGPLDKYLQKNFQTIKPPDMVEAAACLATALWHLEENHVVHGKIRCSEVFVHVHTDNSFIVKLGDPGLFIYTEIDIPWIPPECYADLASAKKSFQADVWALATTIWQIFSRGISLPNKFSGDIVKKFYADGHRLIKPSKCPDEIYKLLMECWSEKNIRKQPQAIMRDINQILYQVYNSRKIHAYATAFPKLFNSDESNDNNNDSEETRSNSVSSSLITNHTNLTWSDSGDTITKQSFNYQDSVDETEDVSRYLDCVINAMENVRTSECSQSIQKNFNVDQMRYSNAPTRSIEQCNNFLGQMQDMSENGDWNVYKLERIGQGFYGEVYRGTRIRKNETQQVAIKKLKMQAEMQADQNAEKDFEKEIEIMKTLKHPNIVEILGNISEPEKCLIMEFIEHGSLQNYLIMHRMTLKQSDKKLLYFALDIATGMDYLGSKNIIHRDLAARNILVASETRVKISDFGLARNNEKNDYYILQTVRELPMKWYALESLKELKFSSRSDVWSFGVTMYEIFSLGEDPKLPDIDLNYKNVTETKGDIAARLVNAYERGIRLPSPYMCPQEVYRQLMYPCWNENSHERPLFAILRQRIEELLKKC